MGQVLLLLVVALTVAAVVFGVTVLVSGRDPGLVPTEPDGRAVPLPGGRPLDELDVTEVRFDTALRGYRMAQVDQAMRRAAYDIGYKSELIGVLEAEVAALREGRTEEAEALRRTREEAARTDPAGAPSPAGDTPSAVDRPADGTTPDADRPAAEAGVAAAPAAAAVEDETVPGADVSAPAGPLAPVAAPVDQEPAERPAALRPPATGSTGEQAADDADAEDDRERGGVVRSESA
ncbi:DivIVA domain-containing protein [Micromonospora narathiwatensis]|uniref:DivIVA domain-containing protein n=1 Tax=Micromonospora narathiwatensis TaxID=299146 RepID=A0A1A9ACX6_9ACTN|nr:DivIVA domain-containing protein [Micromonospora narathiwatensis]SBT54359.1 DivIVA domain-containing protein [Micromonospora narathiwatensis]